jgi:flagellar hook-associated protein 1
MSSIGGILSIARTAIYANQAAIQVASHNISNANTEGYSRQRPAMAAGVPVRLGSGLIGTGVAVHDIGRVRDGYLDLSVRRETSNASGFGLRRDILHQVEGVFGEPSENGLAATLDAFWSAWSDLANTPDSLTARNLVRQRGDQVATTLNGQDRRLSDLEDSTILRMDAQVRELNGLLTRVADLNERIRAAEVGGMTAGDLRDARDLAIDQASRLADLRVLPRGDGTIGLAIGSTNLVDGGDARPLEMSVTRGAGGRILNASVTTRGTTLDQVGAALGGAIDGVADIRGARASLDDLARMITEQVNQIHGSTPLARDFFHDTPEGVTAANIRLADAIRADPANVLAGSSGTDNSIAIELAGLRDLRFALTDTSGDPLLDSQGDPVQQSLGGLYRDLVARIAFEANGAERATAAAETLALQAEMRRESVSGVSIDEELMILMRHQQAYTAATKLVSTADEMLQSILNMV